MGGVASSISDGMSENMAKNTGNMMEKQKEMAMLQRQLMMASQIAMGRERFRYQCYMYGLAYTFLPIIAFVTKNPKACIPLVPISFISAFQYDMLYGNMQVRI